MPYQWLECPCPRKAAFLIFRDPAYDPPAHSEATRPSLYMHRDGTPLRMYDRVICETCGNANIAGQRGAMADLFVRDRIRRGDALPDAEG